MARSFQTPAFALSMAILLLTSFAAYRSISLFKETQRRVDHTFQVIDKLNHLQIGMLDAETGKRGFLITGEDAFLQPYYDALHFVELDLKDLRQLTADNASQQKRLGLLDPLIAQQLAWMHDRIAARRTEGFGAVSKASDLRYGKEMMDRLRELVGAMETDERGLLAKRSARLNRLGVQVRALLIAGTLTTIFLLGYSFSRLEQEIDTRRQTENRLTAANKELEAFSYSVSHDLRAPLRHIAGFSDLLRKDESSQLSEVGRHYVDRTIAAATQMGRLVDDLLSFSRLGRVEMQKSTVNADRLVRDLVRDVAGEVPERRIEWIIDPLPPVHGDPALLRQVFVNLLSNALKYTQPRPVASIHIGVQSQTAGETTLFIRDNGVGFDMRYVDKLFGVFQRLHSTAEFEGTGIGLALVQRIIHRHGGRVRAEGAVDHGATFYFSLPNA